ncbi:MAG: ribosome biogenesis GTP-binding protein YihA/YsxC [Ndongobacter sp.]|nr:ribosome biogenesis GTP-binding protein YihA/YsxC [Ndongobacter sp.]
MIINNAVLEAMAVSPEQYPEAALPEIALAGRSNVGKSTLINRFANRKKLAYTSASPGKTRTVNFYRIEEVFRLVDLPGYGYAKASKEAQRSWAKSIERYLNQRETLREVLLLCDLRHEPTAQDREMYEWILRRGFRGYVIGTKADKIPRTKLPQHRRIIQQSLKIADGSLIFPYSGFTREGVESIHDLVERILAKPASNEGAPGAE